jgi:hypothetical protein
MAEVLKITPDRDNQVPICPHCGKPVDELRYFTGFWTPRADLIPRSPPGGASRRSSDRWDRLSSRSEAPNPYGKGLGSCLSK